MQAVDSGYGLPGLIENTMGRGMECLKSGLYGPEEQRGPNYCEPPQFKLLCDDHYAKFLRHYYNTMAARAPDICDRSNLQVFAVQIMYED